MTENPYTATEIAKHIRHTRLRMEHEFLTDVVDLFELKASSLDACSAEAASPDVAEDLNHLADRDLAVSVKLRQLRDEIHNRSISMIEIGRALWNEHTDALERYAAKHPQCKEIVDQLRSNWAKPAPAPNHTQDAAVSPTSGAIPWPPMAGSGDMLRDPVASADARLFAATAQPGFLGSTQDPMLTTLTRIRDTLTDLVDATDGEPNPLHDNLVGAVNLVDEVVAWLDMDQDQFAMKLRVAVPVDEGREVSPGTGVLNWRSADDSELCTSTITALCSHPRDHNGDHEAIKADGTVQRRWRNLAAPVVPCDVHSQHFDDPTCSVCGTPLEEYPVPQHLAEQLDYDQAVRDETLAVSGTPNDVTPLCPVAGLPAVLQPKGDK